MDKVIKFVFPSILILLMISCNFVDDKKETYGAIHLTFQMQATKLITPVMELTIARYAVSGTGPGSATFSVTDVTAPTLTQEELAAGNWSINVQGKNSTGEIIAEGSAAITIQGELTTHAVITLAPVTGPGGFSLNLSWPAGVITNPGVAATLTPTGGTPEVLTMSLAGTTATYTSQAINGGFYVLKLTLLDGTTELCWIYENVRIVTGHTTAAVFNLTAEEINGPPAAPASLRTDMASATQIELAWSDNSFNEHGFRIERGPSPAELAAIAGLDMNTTGFTDTGLAPATTYFYRVVAFNSFGEQPSEIVSETTDLATLPAPEFSLPAGTYDIHPALAISCPVSGAAIHYTLDGTEPTATNGNVYTVPITIATTTTVKARAALAGYHDSPVAAVVYTINNPGTAVTIGTEMDEPVAITFSGQKSKLGLTGTMTVTATTSVTVDSYAWYLNNTRLTGETSNRVTISGPGLTPAKYRLTCVVTRGNVGCSEYVTFEVLSMSSETLDIASTDVPETIVDISTVYSDIVIGSEHDGSIRKATVTINLTHTYDGDLDIYLISPSGTAVMLSTDNGGGGRNYTNTIFDDAAAASITAGSPPFTGSYRPEEPLSLLNGQAAAGTWRLRIADDAGGDAGTLLAWSIHLATGIGE